MKLFCEICGYQFPKNLPQPIRCLHNNAETTVISDSRPDNTEISRIIHRVEENIAHWIKLHSYPVVNKLSWVTSNAQLFYSDWEQNIPNIGCGCRQDWFELKKTIDFTTQFDSPESFFRWSVDAHNAVNKKLNKPIVSYEEACQIHGF
jgi:hypothetical protein